MCACSAFKTFHIPRLRYNSIHHLPHCESNAIINIFNSEHAFSESNILIRIGRSALNI